MGASVLIIDAEEDFANLLAQTLRTRGVDAQITPDGKAGLDAARINIPDAIILCVELPRMSGYSICAKLKKDPTLKSVPLVITSSEATQETFEHHKKLKTRAEEYLKKPFEPEALFAALAPHMAFDGASEADLPIAEELAIEAEMPMTLSDQEAFGLDAPFDVPGQASAPASDYGFDLGGAAGLIDAPELEEYDGLDGDDEARTMVGTMPIMAQVQDLELEIRRLKEELEATRTQAGEAEQARDDAMFKLSSLPAGASQLPGASASRELLSLKKELSKKEHEILELKDDLQKKGKELLGAKDEQMEIEGRLLQLQEEAEAAAHDKQRLNDQIAQTRSELQAAVERAQAAERQAEETGAALHSLQQRTENEAREAAVELQALQSELSAASARGDELQAQLSDLSSKSAGLEEALDAKTSDLQQVSTEMQDKVSEIESLMGQTRGLGSELTRLGNELSAATAESGTLRSQLANSQSEVEQLEQQVQALRSEYEGALAALQQTRDRLSEAEQDLEAAAQRDVRGMEIRAKARQALEIAAALLGEPVQNNGASQDVGTGEFEVDALQIEDEAEL